VLIVPADAWVGTPRPG